MRIAVFLSWTVGVVVSNNAALRLAALDTTLKPRINSLAIAYNTSYTVAVHHADFEKPWVFTSGIDNHAQGSLMNIGLLIPQGSVTKPFTVATMLKLQEQGIWKLDEPAHKFVDPFLLQHNGTTMLELWKDSRINDVTLRQLGSMQSGIHDYNDTELFTFFQNNPQFDVSPFDMLHQVNKTLWFSPGNGSAYSTTGFQLLGLALANVFKIEHWQDLDQKWIFPHRDSYPGIEFSKPGPCSQFFNMAHQWMALEWPEFQDIIDYSCLNSWAGGNIAATAQDIAQWWLELFDGTVLSPESVREMTTVHLNTDYFSIGSFYAFGLEVLDWGGGKSKAMNDTGVMFGHGGGDYGSCGYGGFQFDYNFSFHWQSNSYVGMNSSAGEKSNHKAKSWVRCSLYNDVLQIMSNFTADVLPCALKPQP